MKSAIRVLLACAIGFSAEAAAIIHSYQFQLNANDSVGSANGTLINGATATGGVLTLNGSQYAQFSSHIVPTSGSYSVFLFGKETVPTTAYMEFISQGLSGGPGFYIGHDSKSSPSSEIIRVSDSWPNTSVLFPSNGGWNSYALVVDAGMGQSLLYVNGVLLATLGSAIATTTSGGDTRFGRQFNPINEYLTGTVADVQIFTGALTAAEVAALAAGGPNAVPEPATFLLISFGLCLVWAMRRVWFKKASL